MTSKDILRTVLSFLLFAFCLTMFFLSGGNASWLADD
jgi:hypothetical protein